MRTPVERALAKIALIQLRIDQGTIRCWRAGRITRLFLAVPP